MKKLHFFLFANFITFLGACAFSPNDNNIKYKSNSPWLDEFDRHVTRLKLETNLEHRRGRVLTRHGRVRPKVTCTTRRCRVCDGLKGGEKKRFETREYPRRETETARTRQTRGLQLRARGPVSALFKSARQVYGCFDNIIICIFRNCNSLPLFSSKRIWSAMPNHVSNLASSRLEIPTEDLGRPNVFRGVLNVYGNGTPGNDGMRIQGVVSQTSQFDFVIISKTDTRCVRKRNILTRYFRVSAVALQTSENGWTHNHARGPFIFLPLFDPPLFFLRLSLLSP